MRTYLAMTLSLLLLSNGVFGEASQFDGLKIVSITVNTQDVFDLDNPKENSIFYRATNVLHIKTKGHVVRQQLLMKEGDVYSQRLVDETERLLRANKYLREAKISAVRSGYGVALLVHTYDTWSTKPKLDFGRTGGNNKSQIGLQEENLFGAGIKLGFSYKKDIDRTSNTLEFSDQNFFGSPYQLSIEYSDNSDGHLSYVSLSKPFLSLDTKTSYGISSRDEVRVDALYYQANSIYSFQSTEAESEAFFGFSSSLKNKAAFRHTFGVDRQTTTYLEDVIQPMVDDVQVQNYVAQLNFTPYEKDTISSFYKIEYLQDKYVETRNVELFGRTEDRYVGMFAGAKFAYVSELSNLEQNYWRVNGNVSNVWLLSDHSSIVAGLDSEFELHNANVSNLASNYSLKYYQDQTDHFKLYAELTGIETHHLDDNKEIFLGGIDGLRGYPARYFNISNAKIFTLEERYYSKTNIWQILHFGGVIFMDVINASAKQPFEFDNSVYTNIGFGLRIANNRTSLTDILHIDFSFPQGSHKDIDPFQLYIKTKKTF